MLKWTVLSRRDHQEVKPSDCNFQSTGSLPNTPRQKIKRRRSSTSRRNSTQKRCSLNALEADKENKFHSTPIKNSPLPEAFSPFRDLSNLTPSRENQQSSKLKIKKKKECLENHEKFVRVSDGSNYFTPFEAVDSHIESILAEELCSCKKPVEGKKPTRETAVNCEQIEATDQATLPGFRPRNLEPEVRVSPLVRKFLDLRFSTVSFENEADNSSIINDMSLDKLVGLLLENSTTTTNTSMIVNVENNHKNEDDRERLMDVNSEASSDSGFKSSTNENSHQLDNNFVCKCNNNNTEEKTMIQINETYNERCVDLDQSRKRTSTTPEDPEGLKRARLEDSCTLKRQRCVRRKKLEHFRKKLSRINGTTIESTTVAPFWSTQKLVHSDEESFAGFPIENTPLRGCYLENKNIRPSHSSGTDSDSNNRTIRKCLMFESPKVDNDSLSFADSTGRSAIVDVRGSLDLRMFCNSGGVYVNGKFGLLEK